MIRWVHLDANVILRFLRNDDPEQLAQAAAVFCRARDDESFQLIVSAVTVLEVFYVLVRAYALPRVEAAQVPIDLFSTGLLDSPDERILRDSLSLITSQRISFGDAWIASSAEADGAEIATFDHGLGAFRGRETPSNRVNFTASRARLQT